MSLEQFAAELVNANGLRSTGNRTSPRVRCRCSRCVSRIGNSGFLSRIARASFRPSILPGMTMSLNTTSIPLFSSSCKAAFGVRRPAHGVAELFEQARARIGHRGIVLDQQDGGGLVGGTVLDLGMSNDGPRGR